MRRTKTALIVSLLLIFTASLNASVTPIEYPNDPSYAPGHGFCEEVYLYQPTPADMYDLDHHKYYTWGIEMPVYPDGYSILGAELVFKNIRNWDSGSNILYVHLLNSADIGLAQGTDNQGGGDYFAGLSNQVLVGEWENDPAGTAVDLVFHFDTALLIKANIYAFDGILGFGIDPDCHYYNDGITFAIDVEACHEPEPTTLCLFGLAGMIMLKKRKQSQL